VFVAFLGSLSEAGSLTVPRAPTYLPVPPVITNLIVPVVNAYLWAVIFGDGIHGGKTGSALENSRDLPNANGALIVAVGVFLASPLYYQWRTEPYRATLGKWYALTAAAGLLLFGASRLIL
jgi:hypothetical protein